MDSELNSFFCFADAFAGFYFSLCFLSQLRNCSVELWFCFFSFSLRLLLFVSLIAELKFKLRCGFCASCCCVCMFVCFWIFIGQRLWNKFMQVIWKRGGMVEIREFQMQFSVGVSAFWKQVLHLLLMEEVGIGLGKSLNKSCGAIRAKVCCPLLVIMVHALSTEPPYSS